MNIEELHNFGNPCCSLLYIFISLPISLFFFNWYINETNLCGKNCNFTVDYTTKEMIINGTGILSYIDLQIWHKTIIKKSLYKRWNK